MVKLTLLISVGLLAACGQTTSTPGSEADGGTPLATALAEAGQTATVGASAATALPTQATAAEKPANVAVLPLKRGFYVASDTPCGNASNATLSLLRRDGIGGARDFCEFTKIAKIAATTYHVTEKCGDLQAGPESEQTGTVVWTIASDNRFTRKSSDGWESSARYCAQSSLPEDWRNNDISDLIG